MREIDLVVFDMAGTTIQDDGQVPQAFAAALAEYGVTVGPDAIRALRGASKREAIRGLLPAGMAQAELTERVYATFCDHLARRFADTAREVAGAAETFAWLRERGVKTALNTGFDRDTALMLMSALKWTNGTVDALVCGDDVPQGRPAPYLIFRCLEATRTVSVRRTASIGDTTLDLRAGDNAGVRWNIGALSGAHNRELLAAEPHTHLLESVADLPTLFSQK